MRPTSCWCSVLPAFLVASSATRPGGAAASRSGPHAPRRPPAPAPAAVPAAMMVDEIKIVLEDKAKTDGEIRLEFTPEGGTAKSIRVTVAKKMSGKDVAEDLEKELKVGLGPDYKVDRYDPDKIKIEAKNKKKFHVALAYAHRHRAQRPAEVALLGRPARGLVADHVDLPQVARARPQKRRHRQLAGGADAPLQKIELVEARLVFRAERDGESGLAHHEQALRAKRQLEVQPAGSRACRPRPPRGSAP